MTLAAAGVNTSAAINLELPIEAPAQVCFVLKRAWHSFDWRQRFSSDPLRYSAPVRLRLRDRLSGGINELVPLIGEHGLTPATHYLSYNQAELGSRAACMFHLPTLFWFEILITRCGPFRGAALFYRSWSCGIRQRFRHGDAVASLHVDRSRRPDLVRLRMGNPAVGDWLSFDFSLPTPGLAALFGPPATASRHLAISMARLSHHGWRGSDKLRGDPAGEISPACTITTRRSRSQSAQPLSSFRASLAFTSSRPGGTTSSSSSRPGFLSARGQFSDRRRGDGFLSGPLMISGNLSFLNWLTIVPFIACFRQSVPPATPAAGLHRQAIRGLPQ